ncbi:tRNA (guanosine(37)-N1)-methyltransferase TrmD [Myxococcota bacterium]|nr:tRNA (guanosine(37)-N1)-methyltransferase TrmD [Myxococcota bacterium]MCZ7618448.1 tRNA (guanosine(37)-N1)-methyltransferase TrmD [Myxococcota bacterium]
MRIDVVTIFPGLFEPFRSTALLGAACSQGVVDLRCHDLRQWTRDRHRTVDDTPYGGGPGMVMKPEPLVEAIEALAGPKGDPTDPTDATDATSRTARVLLMSPQGRRLDQARVAAWAQETHLVLVCGRYEGVDQRVIDLAVDEEVSIGDYVLAGGELPALVVIEAVTRLLPGVMGNPASAETESFQQGLLEGPQYTRPAVYRGHEVPAVLRSGDHAAVARWRAERAQETTTRRRPDLLGAGRGEEPR